MKILFHPSFDNGCYVKLDESKSNTLGTKAVGLAGLLDHLSLHNGLSGRFPSDGERASAYLSHVSKCAGGTMIAASFKNDPLGVAKCLLHWRDALIMCGWTPGQSGNVYTPKLQLLSQIETSWKAQEKGSADRWLELVSLAKKQPLIDGTDSIECSCAKESLPYLVQQVLTACKATFVEYPGSVQIPDETQIEVVQYNDLLDAYKQVASHDEYYKEYVIINRDNVSLNHILFSWGKPLVGATIEESNPLTLQLFKLAMSVFSRPLNIQNLVSYLQLPVGPVPGKLRYALANILIAEGGFGDIDWNDIDEDKAKELQKAKVSSKWDLAIYNYIHDDEDKTSTPVQRSSKTNLLRYITDPTIDGKNIPTDVLKKYIGNINQWASAMANNEDVEDEMLKSQLSTVVSYFKQLANTLCNTDTISYLDLEKHVRTIYQPISMTQAFAQVGPLHVVNSITQLLDSPQNLLWLDCCGADEKTDQYEFLNSAEKDWLNSQEGILIPRLKDLLELDRKEMITILSAIKGKIKLVTSNYHHNQKMAEHPLVAELKMQRGDKLSITEGSLSLDLTPENDIVKLEPQLQYELGKICLPGRSESNTSIDTLINYPFDYTAHYVARLGEPSDKELASLQKIIGLVAHSFIENLVASAKSDLTKMKELLASEYDMRFKEAVETKGLILLLKENQVDYNNLHFLLRRSMEVLIHIMEQKNLTPVGCELKHTEPLGEIGDFNARIDMELQDENGNAVIFDFKWSYSKYYGDKIKDGKAIQLELYKKELEEEGKQVSAVGYYLMPKCVLETPDYKTLKDADGKIIISHIDAPADLNLFEQIKNSVNQRREEIQAGTIEEGEGMDIIDLPYSKALLDGGNLMEVGTRKKPRKTKDNPDPKEKIIKESNKVFTNKPESRFKRSFKEFENKNAPLNEQTTTYPLLKGRLK